MTNSRLLYISSITLLHFSNFFQRQYIHYIDSEFCIFHQDKPIPCLAVSYLSPQVDLKDSNPSVLAFPISSAWRKVLFEKRSLVCYPLPDNEEESDHMDEEDAFNEKYGHE